MKTEPTIADIAEIFKGIQPYWRRSMRYAAVSIIP